MSSLAVGCGRRCGRDPSMNWCKNSGFCRNAQEFGVLFFVRFVRASVFFAFCSKMRVNKSRQALSRVLGGFALVLFQTTEKNVV
jgi:hypothetical protein